jgi:hypothetical protein
MLAPVKLQKLSGGPFRRKQAHLAHRKLPFLQNLTHLFTDSARGADNCGIVLWLFHFT